MLGRWLAGVGGYYELRQDELEDLQATKWFKSAHQSLLREAVRETAKEVRGADGAWGVSWRSSREADYNKSEFWPRALPKDYRIVFNQTIFWSGTYDINVDFVAMGTTHRKDGQICNFSVQVDATYSIYNRYSFIKPNGQAKIPTFDLVQTKGTGKPFYWGKVWWKQWQINGDGRDLRSIESVIGQKLLAEERPKPRYTPRYHF
jgi:hypothetical protein